MGHHHHSHRLAEGVVLRDELANGYVVSTVRLQGLAQPFETKVFSPGWPAQPNADEVETRRAADLATARAYHAELAASWSAAKGSPPSENPADANWVFRLLGLPNRRFPKGLG